MTHIITIEGATPKVGQNVFVAPTATLSGDVELADSSSVFYGVSVRGDSAPIHVGEGSNLQETSCFTPMKAFLVLWAQASQWATRQSCTASVSAMAA